jgi:anti-sigma28 factor (negative regulator of flagellin synthesis)
VCPRARRHPSSKDAHHAARRRRIEQIKKEIEAGTYETEGKLRIALARLVDDVLAQKAEADG